MIVGLKREGVAKLEASSSTTQVNFRFPVSSDPSSLERSGGGKVKARRGSSLTRLWTIVEALRTAKRGLTVNQLIERTGSSRASIYRDLEVLRSSDVPIDKRLNAGEMRYALPSDPAAVPRTLTPLQAAALLTSRRALSSLEGTRLVRELDALLQQLARGPRAANRVHVPLSLALAPDRLSIIDRALDRRKCLRLRYRGVRDASASWRVVEPMELRVSGDHPYLVAYDRATGAYRTYKLARITHVQPHHDRTRMDAHYRADELFEHSRGIWSGPAENVEVRLDAAVARFATEWPLERSQSITDAGNGDVIVRARVAGLHEPLRWVLRWGRHAEVIAPAQLREMVVAELSSALEGYRKSRRTDRGVSNGETGVA